MLQKKSTSPRILLFTICYMSPPSHNPVITYEIKILLRVIFGSQSVLASNILEVAFKCMHLNEILHEIDTYVQSNPSPFSLQEYNFCISHVNLSLY